MNTVALLYSVYSGFLVTITWHILGLRMSDVAWRCEQERSDGASACQTTLCRKMLCFTETLREKYVEKTAN
jgi:hypothetical protein